MWRLYRLPKTPSGNSEERRGGDTAPYLDKWKLLLAIALILILRADYKEGRGRTREVSELAGTGANRQSRFRIFERRRKPRKPRDTASKTADEGSGTRMG